MDEVTRTTDAWDTIVDKLEDELRDVKHAGTRKSLLATFGEVCRAQVAVKNAVETRLAEVEGHAESVGQHRTDLLRSLRELTDATYDARTDGQGCKCYRCERALDAARDTVTGVDHAINKETDEAWAKAHPGQVKLPPFDPKAIAAKFKESVAT